MLWRWVFRVSGSEFPPSHMCTNQCNKQEFIIMVLMGMFVCMYVCMYACMNFLQPKSMTKFCINKAMFLHKLCTFFKCFLVSFFPPKNDILWNIFPLRKNRQKWGKKISKLAMFLLHIVQARSSQDIYKRILINFCFHNWSIAKYG